VQNLSDGRVEIAAEGESEALERFERDIQHGPPQARVDAMEITDVGAEGRSIGFEVR
jgi:acylphosphatase